MLEALLLLCRRVITHEVLVGSEQVGRLHSTASLRAQDAFHHYAPTQIESPAIVADPVVVGNFINTITPLMYRDIASSTKDNQVLIFIVAIIANCTLGVLLDHKSTLVSTERVVALKVKA